MLREFLDTAILEDFVDGLSRSSSMRVSIFDEIGRLITVSPPRTEFAKLTGRHLASLPHPIRLTPIPADQPPVSIAFVEDRGVWHVVAPVHLVDRLAGFVGVGEMRDVRSELPPQPDSPLDADALQRWLLAWRTLPPLERSGESRTVATVRWASRVLAEWCRAEDQLRNASAELAFVADISEVLGGEQHLQTVLERIVADTARVMKCPYGSLRLYDPVTDSLAVAAVHNLAGGYVARDIRQRADAPIDDEALSGRTVYIEDAQTDPRIPDPVHARQLGIVSGLITGIFYHGRPIGTLRVYAGHKRRFRIAQRNLLRAVASQAAIAIVNAQLLEDRLRSSELQRQLELAGQVQTRMIRSQPPSPDRIETAVVFEPSSHVGGDFCDLFTLPDGRVAACIGDVVGHGVPAALLMASVRGALRSYSETCSDLAEIVTRLGRYVFRETSTSEFVTMILLAIEPDRCELTFCCAGHEPPLIFRDGNVTAYEAGGLVLGIDPNEKYEADRVALRPGDLCLLYTDGVIEAMDFASQT
ncbi:MAG: PP2C family protein-serine/threonine phosphatase, partial [Phycisphaerae bacterium]